MMDDVEAGKVNCIATKDLSRFGREHVMMDYYLEFVFPEKQIRYIAVTENEDTEKGLSDFVPFKKSVQRQPRIKHDNHISGAVAIKNPKHKTKTSISSGWMCQPYRVMGVLLWWTYVGAFALAIGHNLLHHITPDFIHPLPRQNWKRS